MQYVVGGKKPHLPIFVGSTFTDMQEYRKAVQAALGQLETIVRGMEYFGSKPGSPVEECLSVVRSCKVYVGVFGMRYGSIPDNNDKSMTHLEYNEAQRLELPSLAYIIDEENQPILPKHVETGPGAEKLRALKDELKKRHMVSFFTSPQDLRARILHDIPELLKNMGADVSGSLKLPGDLGDEETLSHFEKLPKMFSGREVSVEFINEASFDSAMGEACKALGLEIGATVTAYVNIAGSGRLQVFAERDLAFRLCQLQKGVRVQALAVTAFGAYTRVDWTDDGPFATPETEIGVILKRILNVDHEKE